MQLSSHILKKPGCGSSLGEATDDVNLPAERGEIVSNISSDDDEYRVKQLKFVSQKPVTPGEGIAMLGQSFDGGFGHVSKGLKAIASSLSGGEIPITKSKNLLSENREALAKTNNTLERVGNHLERAEEVQEAMLKFMQTMMAANEP